MEFSGSCPNTVYLWLAGRNLPRLGWLLKLCCQFNLSLVEFLTVPLSVQTCQTQTEKSQLQSLSVPTRREVNAVKETRVRQGLAAALLEDPTPPLAEVTRCLGYERTGSLYRQYSDLCRQITARYQAASGQQVQSRTPPNEERDRQIRQPLKQELDKENPRRPGELAAEVGYKHASTVYRRFPDLWRALIAKRSAYKQEQRRRQFARERQVLAAALGEEPPPAIKAITKRLGYRSEDRLFRHFPAECCALGERRPQREKDRLEGLKTKLQAALSEEPPRLMRQVADELGYDCSTLYGR